MIRCDSRFPVFLWLVTSLAGLSVAAEAAENPGRPAVTEAEVARPAEAKPVEAKPVEAKPGHNRDEEGLGVVDVTRPGKAQIGILHHVFGVAAAAEHAVGKPEQAPAMGRQRIILMRPVWRHRHCVHPL